MMHKCESLAEKVTRHLQETGKTQVAFEAETGITDTSIARIRSGTLPGKWIIPPLALALGITESDLRDLVARERAERDRKAKRAGKVVGRRVHGQVSCPKPTRTPARRAGRGAK